MQVDREDGLALETVLTALKRQRAPDDTAVREAVGKLTDGLLHDGKTVRAAQRTVLDALATTQAEAAAQRERAVRLEAALRLAAKVTPGAHAYDCAWLTECDCYIAAALSEKGDTSC